MVIGAMIDHNYYSFYKGEVKGAAQAQEKNTTAANAANKGEAHVSTTELVEDLQAVHQYYLDHPVERVRIVRGACIMPSAPDNPKGPDESGTGMFVTVCNPEDATRTAVILRDLQDRLRAAEARGAVVIQ